MLPTDPVTTHGLIVYQEQVMKTPPTWRASMGKADVPSMAMGKKKMDILAKMFVEFEAGWSSPASPRRASRHCGTSSFLRQVRSNKAHSALTALCPTDGLPQGALSPSTWLPCSPARRTTRTPAVHLGSAATWASPSCLTPNASVPSSRSGEDSRPVRVRKPDNVADAIVAAREDI